MNEHKKKGIIIVVASFIVALMMTALPLPEWAANWRPAWVAMVLIYWCMALPNKVNIGVAWIAGIIMDVLQGTLLGQNALGLVLLAFITIKVHQRIRMFPLIQQALFVMVLILLYQLMSLWVRGLMGVPPRTWTYWTPAITSMVLWPWLFIILRDIRRKYIVS
ncbi:MAG: rod shape-determining protein MreD [Gammaproteobacteria bacterium]|nr:rod shape-determining protein MreD [Gammaproteobacteria bacterium]NIN61825.1 rod shape-determining protein MreD [Gammaproteobacteria bacterium]NIO63568.1 rod shape-determining protein MreD [Gammaproteobacteria bacterium]NIP49369.1 rod shape-determining protein MreD [Gammaproteobacteria bacterium]NIQ10593.1 rod shape-determining protein MreD [Gammaproteobacteria bacterium]